MLLNCGVGEDSWESLGLQGDPTSPFWRRSALGFLWRAWCWSWNSNTLATSCEELTHWKRLWCWKGWEQEEKGMTEDEMAGWHHRLHGHEFGWTPEVCDGQGGLECCNSWDCKESDTTEQLNWPDSHPHQCISSSSLWQQSTHPLWLTSTFCLFSICSHWNKSSLKADLGSVLFSDLYPHNLASIRYPIEVCCRNDQNPNPHSKNNRLKLVEKA